MSALFCERLQLMLTNPSETHLPSPPMGACLCVQGSVDAKDLNSGLHGCVASISLTQPYPKRAPPPL